jgi:ABC-type Fe3+ transport system substrate-binding protein
MPEFFAHRVKHQERIRIIWPADGALASPVTLLVKKDRVAALQPVLDYLTGQELARVLVGARFPTPHADVPGELQELPLKWPGWNFLRGNDLAAVNAAIDAVFLPAVKEVVQ